MPYLAQIALVVRDYDEALAFYVGKLGFALVEDSHQRSRTTADTSTPNERRNDSP